MNLKELVEQVKAEVRTIAGGPNLSDQRRYLREIAETVAEAQYFLECNYNDKGD